MAEDAGKVIVHLDVAKSGRSTCRATGEKIEKGEHRVGVEAYTGGHISMTWQVSTQLTMTHAHGFQKLARRRHAPQLYWC